MRKQQSKFWSILTFYLNIKVKPLSLAIRPLSIYRHLILIRFAGVAKA